MTNEELKNVGTLVEYKDYILWLLGLVVTALFYILNQKNNELKDVKNKLSESKYDLYNRVYSVMFNLIKEKDKTSKPNTKLVNELLNIKKDMFIYAPDIVLNKFLEWNNNIGKESDVLVNMNTFFDLLLLIRKDMGNSKTNLKKEDIIRGLLASDEEYTKLKN